MTDVQRILVRNPSGRGDIELVPSTTGGAGAEGKPIAARTDTGLMDATFLPPGVAPETITGGVCGAASLAAGRYVNIYNDTGVKKIRYADWTDATKPSHGFVLNAYTLGDPVVVYKESQKNNLIPVGSFVAADAGKPLYLNVNGTATLTRPVSVSDAGKLDQELGIVDDVGGVYVTSVYSPQRPITVA
jgi:hypothetical protein